MTFADDVAALEAVRASLKPGQRTRDLLAERIRQHIEAAGKRSLRLEDGRAVRIVTDETYNAEGERTGIGYFITVEKVEEVAV